MKPNEVVGDIIVASGKSERGISKELNHDRTWARLVRYRKNAPRIDTVADIAHVAGYRIDVVNDSTGEVLGTVEPPCIERLAGGEADGVEAG